MQNNIEIRNAIFTNNIKKWKIAEKLGVTDSTFSKMLRKELTKEKKNTILNIIKDLQKEVK